MAPPETLIKKNEVVWLKSSDDASWAGAGTADVVSEATAGAKTVRILDGKGERDVSKALVELACVGQEDAEDIAELSNLNEPSLMELIRTRYSSGEYASIYTRAGPVLVAVNPFTDVSKLYSDDMREQVMTRRAHLPSPPAARRRARSGSLRVRSGRG